ncbi:MAG: fumarylacetoacetate hydrolase family protein [Bdellovibrionales bacterium]|nr:fumarylacetoacetate hydrolase family protein [Bdellovibrionales bacterium]
MKIPYKYFNIKIEMKLASIKSDHRDADLIVVSSDNKKGVHAKHIARSLREAIENWPAVKPALEDLYRKLNPSSLPLAFPIPLEKLSAPLPRSFAWIDGSAYIQHIKLVRKARGAPLPETLETIPLIYQGGSDLFLGPYDDIPQEDFSHGTDFEAEVGVIVNDVPMGVSPEKALDHIILFTLINDISLRGLIPEELKRGFGFFQGKPSSSFAPFVVTKEELGDAWKEGRIHLPMLVEFNGKSFGQAQAGEMHFHFGQIIAHAAQTRSLSAGTIIGSGTVSNQDSSVGCSCIAEKRMLEKINTGKIKTDFMKIGDQVEIKMINDSDQNIFGTIKQKVSSLSKVNTE